MIRRITATLFLALFACASYADEIRPGYLEIRETGTDTFSVLWKVPAKGDKKLGLEARLPASCEYKNEPVSRLVNSAYIRQWIAHCPGGIAGEAISIAGLEITNTDVLLRLEFLNGTSSTTQLTPTRNTYRVEEETSSLQIAGTFTTLGIEHILLGFDHLLFVFALLLIVKGRRRLIWTITAFTLAHSVTLTGATLGFMQVPSQPVEAIIALSILFLAVEIMHGKQGRPGYAARWPWLVAFAFGLLHGFGFAGALAEIGLPQQAIPLALVSFNIGVEIGQLLFVFAVLAVGWLLKQLKQHALIERAEDVVVYSIGGLSAFWLIERTSLF